MVTVVCGSTRSLPLLQVWAVFLERQRVKVGLEHQTQAGSMRHWEQDDWDMQSIWQEQDETHSSSNTLRTESKVAILKTHKQRCTCMCDCVLVFIFYISFSLC